MCKGRHLVLAHAYNIWGPTTCRGEVENQGSERKGRPFGVVGHDGFAQDAPF